VTAILSPHVQDATSLQCQPSINGGELLCPETADSYMALVLNELATNSVKYGALGADGGCVSVSWQVTDDRLIHEWEESGGPEALSPRGLDLVTGLSR
jgi:two-component sensor histidine kinase